MSPGPPALTSSKLQKAYNEKILKRDRQEEQCYGLRTSC